MGLLDSLKGFYTSAEEKYYSFLDTLDESGIPVYKVVDAIEASNIPSFPIAIIFALLFFGLIAWFVNGALFANSTLIVDVSDAAGVEIAAASVTVFVDSEQVATGTTNNSGNAELKVPLNKDLEIKIEKDGFLDKTSSFVAENSEESLSITLQREITTLRKTINFLESGTTRLLDQAITVDFSCTSASSYRETKTISNGSIDLDLPNNCGILVAVPQGNVSFDSESIFLSSDSSFNFFVEEDSGVTGSAIVSVANNKAESLPGIDVSLYIPTSTNTPGTVYKTSQTSSNGVAAFDNVPLGRYYVVAFDRTGNYAEYDGLKQNVIQNVSENGFTQFSLVMQDNVAGAIKLLVKDKLTDELVEGARVSLSKGETQITTKYSDTQGRVDFGVGEDVSYHLEIDKPGYLLANLDTRPGNDTHQILIEQATIENSQSLLVIIKDENGKPIENMRVKLKRNNDNTQVGPELVTGLDGRVIFERVEDGLYFVYAIKPGFGEKTSALISMNSRQENVLILPIPLGFGKIQANIFDEDGNPVTDASIRIVDTFSGELLEETTTDSDGKKTIDVRADKKVFLVVNATGFANSVTTQMQMQKDATLQKNVVLRRSVQNFELEFDGLYFNDEVVSESTRALSAGQKYTAKFTLLVPQNTAFEEAGVHIRTGAENSDTIEKDSLYITEVRSASQKLQKGTSYTPPNNQAEDFSHLTNGNAKWTNISFNNIQPGVYEIEADVQIRDEARIGSALDLWYRAYAKSGGYLRFPNDTVLGTAANSGEKEGLYANALKRTYSVGPTSLCGEEFCSRFSITDLRENLTTNLFDEVTAQIGSKYRLNFEMSSVSETPFSQTQFSIKDRSSGLALESFSIKTATGETRTGNGVGSELNLALGDIRKDSVISGEIIIDARKEGSIPLEISIISGTNNATEVFKKTIIVKVLPAEKLNAEILPKVIVPLINNNILVRVTRDAIEGAEAVPVSNAVVNVSVNNAAIVSGQTDSDGVFAFTLNSPADGATIGILVEKTGFRRIEKELKVNSDILLTEPKQVKLLLTIGGAAFKTIEADLLNATTIPLDVDAIAASTDFQGFAEFSFDAPLQGTIIIPDGNAQLNGRVKLGPEGASISQPLTLKGGIGIQVSNSNFDKKWISEIPLEITFGFGDEVDDTECFNAFPAEWKVFGSTTQTYKTNITLANSCAVNSQKISLKDVSARIVSGNDNLLGAYKATSSIGEGRSIQLNNTFQSLGSLAAGAEEPIAIEFLPQNIVSGATEAKIEFQATHLTSNGEQRIIRSVKITTNVNNLSECIEILSPEEITVQSCAFNTGYGNFGGQFSDFSNSRYSQFDPYSANHGYGTGLPPFIGTDFQQNSRFGDSYYDYQGANYPNSNYSQPFYNGSYSGSFYNQNLYGGGNYNQNLNGGNNYNQNFGYGTMPINTGANNSWSCNQGGFAVRNNCSTSVDLSFNAQPGITVAERTISVAAGEEAEVSIEPTNFFGRYSLDVSAKPSESAERSTEIKRLSVNVVNEAAKNYQDCISVSPANTLNFNNFFGKPAVITLYNSCYNEGVLLQENNGAIFFQGTGVNTPTNADSGFREMIESWAFLPPTQFITGADGKVTQVLKFEVVKNLEQYRRNAPPANFFEANDFANIGNLRYFISNSYYSVFGRTNMIVNFTAPYGGQRSTAFPMKISDYWAVLGFGDSIGENFQSYGDGRFAAKDCINSKALDFTYLEYTSYEREYKTVDNQNGKLFIIGEKGGCGSADSLKDVSPLRFTNSSTGVTMIVSPDPEDPRHELVLTFEAPNGISRRIDFRESSQGRVVRVSPPSSALVGLPIKINIEKTEGTPGNGEPGGTGEGQFTCAEGKSGSEIYKKLGLQHIHYAWETDEDNKELGVKENACNALEKDGDTLINLDADSPIAPWFCDGAQSLIEFDRKVGRVKAVVAAAGLESGIGTCTETTENVFDCENETNKNSLELFRYVLSQKSGYFTQNGNTEVLNLLDNAQSITELKVSSANESRISSMNTLVQQLNAPDLSPTYVVANEDIKDRVTQSKIFNAKQQLINEIIALQQNDFKGIEVALEIKGWNQSNVTNGDILNPALDIGAVTLGNEWQVLPLDKFKDLNDKVVENLNQSGLCATAQVCEITLDGKTRKLGTTFLLELIRTGNWKVTARNTNDLGDLAKKLVMKKGYWPTNQPGYDNFWQFYKNNIKPDMYLIEEQYDQGLFTTFDSKYESDLAAVLPDKKVNAGKDEVELKYFWGTTQKGKTLVTFKHIITLNEINDGYQDNVLFTIPIDGALEWGTGFQLGNKDALYFNNYQPGTYSAKSKGNISATLEYKNNYSDTKTGQLMSITKTKFIVSPSDPVRLDVSVSKSETQNAGFLYSLQKGESATIYIDNTLNWTVKDSGVSGYGNGSIEEEQHLFNELCQNDRRVAGTNNYNGFIIGGTGNGNVEYTSIAFLPTIINTDRYFFNLQCIKQSGSVTATYLDEETTELASTNGAGILAISERVRDDISKVPQREKYNLQRLLDLVNKGTVCIDSSSGSATLSWNDRFWESE